VGGYHQLICGHWIQDYPWNVALGSPWDIQHKPCGANCKDDNPKHKLFDCPQCRELVRIILANISPEDKETIQCALKLGPQFKEMVIAYEVELVTKSGKFPGNVEEVVRCMRYSGYGRPCKKAVEQKGVKYVDIFQEMEMVKRRKEYDEIAANSRGSKRATSFHSSGTAEKRVTLNKKGQQKAPRVYRADPVDALVPCRKRKAAVTNTAPHDRETKRDRTE
jgi:hypothetical protein